MKFLHSNDDAGVHASSWYSTTSHYTEQPSLDGDHTCDVCIIGAGFTGLSAALHLAEAGVNVTVLEAHRVGWGASGRNGGQLGTGFNKQETLAKRFDSETALTLMGIAEDAKRTVHQLCNTYKINCDYVPGIVYALGGKRADKEASELCDYFKKNFAYTDATALSQHDMREQVNSQKYQAGILDMGAGHLHPLKLAHGLAKAAISQGAQIFELSEATEIVHSHDGSKQLRVQTQHGAVQTDSLLIACNGYLDSLAPEVAAYVFPINNFIIATEPLGTLGEELLPGNFAVSDDRFVVNYFRLSKDKRLLFGGGETYSSVFPTDIDKRVRRAMLQIFPQLEQTKIEHAWGGTLAITENRLPYVRELQRDIYTAGGYSGHGVALATETGKIIAEKITGRTKRFDTLAALDHRSFPKNPVFRSAMLKASMSAAALLDRLR